MKHIFIAVLLLVTRLFVFSQTADETKKVAGAFAIYNKTHPQEKAYLSCNKPYYTQGDTIWFRVFLTDAMTHQPSALSKVVYVDLISPTASVVSHKILEYKNNAASGDIAISDSLPFGQYQLRAYTRWMTNFDESFFFKKEITITSTGNDAKLHVLALRTNDSVDVAIEIADMSFLEMRNQRFKYKIRLNNKEVTGSTTFDSIGKGIITIPYFRFASRPDKAVSVKVTYTKEGKDVIRNFKTPLLVNDLDVKFFPEGGNLVSGIPAKVAFKAVDGSQHGVAMQGVIIDQNRKEITRFASDETGMGVFYFVPEKGNSYRARVFINDSLHTYKLPKALDRGYVMSCRTKGKNVFVSISSANNAATEQVYLLAMMRGQMQFIHKIEMKDKEKIVSFTRDSLQGGILQLTLLDSMFAPHCERLVFIEPKDDYTVSIVPDKQTYGQKNKVTLTIKTLDKKGQPMPADIALRAYDEGMIGNDSLFDADNILSYFYLSSDISGKIEFPAKLINTSGELRYKAIDMIMLTNGWRRYNIDEVMKGSVKPCVHPYENALVIKGKLTRPPRRSSVNANKVIVTIKDSLSTELQTLKVHPDSTFNIRIDNFYENITLSMFSKNKKGIQTDMEMMIMPDNLPDVNTQGSGISFYDPRKQLYISEKKASLLKMYDNYQNSSNVINLKEITVTAQRRYSNEDTKLYSTADYTANLDEDPMSKMYVNIIDYIIAKFPGMRLYDDPTSGEKELIYARASSNKCSVALMVDEAFSDADILTSIPTGMVQSVDFVYGANASVYGYQGECGIIAIYMRRGFKNYAPAEGKIMQALRAYDKVKEFSYPDYDKDAYLKEMPDFRSALYWNPHIVTDATGTAHISFYNTDNRTTIRVEAEGMTTSGSCGTGSATYQVK